VVREFLWQAAPKTGKRAGRRAKVKGEMASSSRFPVPIGERYFEDYLPGSVYEFAADLTVNEKQIIDFATEYDPQSIHVDPAAAAEGPFGGIIASGWQTASLMMRLFADHYLSTVASLSSPGVDELRWLKPVRPGNSLRLRATVVEAKRSRSKPDRGVVRTLAELIDQDGDVVFRVTAMNILRSRER
jgi:acyl dehydratase